MYTVFSGVAVLLKWTRSCRLITQCFYPTPFKGDVRERADWLISIWGHFRIVHVNKLGSFGGF